MQIALNTLTRRAGAVTLALAAGVVGGMLASPSTSEAVGGLSLQDRILLTGTPRSYYVGDCNDPNAPRVPEGRRLFIYQFEYQLGPLRDLDITLGSWSRPSTERINHGTNFINNWVAVRATQPIVIQGGQPIAMHCRDQNGNDQARWDSYLVITQAHEF